MLKFYTRNQVRPWHIANLSISRQSPSDRLVPLLHAPGIKDLRPLFLSHCFFSRFVVIHFPSVSPLNTQVSLIITQIFVMCNWPTFYLLKAAEKLFKSLIIIPKKINKIKLKIPYKRKAFLVWDGSRGGGDKGGEGDTVKGQQVIGRWAGGGWPGLSRKWSHGGKDQWRQSTMVVGKPRVQREIR